MPSWWDHVWRLVTIEDVARDLGDIEVPDAAFWRALVAGLGTVMDTPKVGRPERQGGVPSRPGAWPVGRSGHLYTLAGAFV